MMRHIEFSEPTTAAWADWRERCGTAQAALINSVLAGNREDAKQVLYKEQKISILMDCSYPFRGKCAYCERDLGNQHGDVEHYRPKDRVTGLDGKRITRCVGGITETHPGYYWLAYDWSNLLPSCIMCNRPSKEFSAGKLIGKWDRFPVDGFRAWSPGDEAQELPLLIHPVQMKPTQHIVFNRNGVFGWRTVCGQTTVEVLGLNEHGLPDRRKDRYEEVRSVTQEYVFAYRTDCNSPRTLQLFKRLERIKDGYGEFTTYGIMAIQDEFMSITEAINRFAPNAPSQ